MTENTGKLLNGDESAAQWIRISEEFKRITREFTKLTLALSRATEALEIHRQELVDRPIDPDDPSLRDGLTSGTRGVLGI